MMFELDVCRVKDGIRRATDIDQLAGGLGAGCYRAKRCEESNKSDHARNSGRTGSGNIGKAAGE
jgi:hypothetical protein